MTRAEGLARARTVAPPCVACDGVGRRSVVSVSGDQESIQCLPCLGFGYLNLAEIAILIETMAQEKDEAVVAAMNACTMIASQHKAFDVVSAISNRAAKMFPEAAARVPQEVHDSGWQWRPTGKDTAFAPPFGTIRQCLMCGALVAGGPTVCRRCG